MLLAPRGDPVQFRSKGFSIPSENGEVWACALITLLSSKAVGGAVLRFFSGRGVEFSGVRSAPAAALLLRLRMAAPSAASLRTAIRRELELRCPTELRCQGTAISH